MIRRALFFFLGIGHFLVAQEPITVEWIYGDEAARLTGTLDIYDAVRNIRVETCQLGTEVLFEHYASTFQGDRRALSRDSRNRIGNSPAPFPQNEDMLVQAADRIKPEIRDELRHSKSIF